MAVQASKRGPGKYAVIEHHIAIDIEHISFEHLSGKAWQLQNARSAATGEPVPQEVLDAVGGWRLYDRLTDAKYAAAELCRRIAEEQRYLAEWD